MIRKAIPRLAALAVAIAFPAALGACVVVETGASCKVDGKTYAPGDTFPASDGCNTCTCGNDGTASCTLLGCAEPCVYEGKTYPPGSVFTASDGCNQCNCSADGTVYCGHGLCGCVYEGQTYEIGDTFPDPNGCGTCVCQQNGSVVCEGPGCPGCIYQGQMYPDGSSFPAGDGCNTCLCEAGMVSCSGAMCPTCTYAGKTYQPGDSFPALDGCNTCTCGSDGSVGCTKVNCACDPAKEWWRHYVATDPATCMVIDYGCPMNTVGFDNACGCGCEQDASCPQTFDCMPPANCDVPKIMAQCPYSTIAF
jgi:hypothetical protein